MDGTVSHFVGRVDVCTQLDGLIGQVTQRGTAVLVLGAAGIGKSALLNQLAGRCWSRLLRARGLESESVIPYAAVADILGPLLPFADAIPAAQQRALMSALALSDGEVTSQLAVCAGALSLLAVAGEAEPLVVLVDDLHWVDEESQKLLLFAARRLASEHVVMIFAARDERGIERLADGLTTVHLDGLTVDDCAELAAKRSISVSNGRLATLVRVTGGNPLAVLENLTQENTRLNDTVIVGSRLQQAWSSRLKALPGPTQHALFVVAVAPSQPAVPGLLAELGLSLGDLAPAEEDGLVERAGGWFELRHPLLRQVVIDATPLGTQLATYQSLASRTSSEERVWFAALATIGRDERVAADLESAAEAARARGGYGTAARMLKRAADLTPDSQNQCRRLLSAATYMLLSGDAATAEHWSALVSVTSSDDSFAAQVTTIRSTALNWMGHPSAAFDQFFMTAETLKARSPILAAELLARAVMPASMAGQAQGSAMAARRSEALYQQAGAAPSFAATVNLAVNRIIQGRGWEKFLQSAETDLPEIDFVIEQPSLVSLVQGYSWIERHDEALALINRVVEAARTEGAGHMLAYSLGVRADLTTRIGRWTNAYADADESIRWAEELQQRGALGFNLVIQARIDAARGRRLLVERNIVRSRREVGPYGVEVLRLYESAALGLAALTEGDPRMAFEHLQACWRATREWQFGTASIVGFAPDLAEAAIRSGHSDQALELVEWLQAQTRISGLAYPEMITQRCQGMLAQDPDDASAAFAAALSLEARCRMPFERSRTLLAQGEMLRRSRQPAQARQSLREAHRVFAGLGADPWAQRAARELAAAGARVESPIRVSGIDQLSPQELQVARIVAEGKNNDEVAEALFVSRKTVEAHLTRVYRKLDVRSRNELTAFMNRTGALG